MPNRWSVTHYLFTYETGFIKRGLWGETLRVLLGSWTAQYFCLAAIGLLVFAAMVVLLVILSRRLSDDPDRVPVLLVFLTSPALTFAAHMVGYLEQIVYLLLLIVLIPRRRWTVQVATAIVVAAMTP